MKVVTKANDNDLRLLMNDRGQVYAPQIIDPRTHRQRVFSELRSLGMTKYGLWRAESQYLPSIIHHDEHVGGVVYGRDEDGFAMLIATDRRIIFLDKKPLFINKDEINYFVVSGVSFGQVGLGITVALHTRIKDYKLRTFNEQCARSFVSYIESRSLEHKSNRNFSDEYLART